MTEKQLINLHKQNKKVAEAQEFAASEEHTTGAEVSELVERAYLEGLNSGYEEINALEKQRNHFKELADNRGKFIDWVLENYPDIAKEYNGF